jgi:hypothetical protein
MDDPFDKDGRISETARIVWKTDAHIAASKQAKNRRIILNKDKQVKRPKLLDAYGAEIEPEEEPYIPCLDGTDRGPSRNRIVRSEE